QGKHNPAWMAKFLASFAEQGIVAVACRAAGVSRKTLYQRRTTDEQFKAAFDHAELDAADALEAEAVRRATQGTRRVKFDKDGEPLQFEGKTYIEHEYSDHLLLALL